MRQARPSLRLKLGDRDLNVLVAIEARLDLVRAYPDAICVVQVLHQEAIGNVELGIGLQFGVLVGHQEVTMPRQLDTQLRGSALQNRRCSRPLDTWP